MAHPSLVPGRLSLLAASLILAAASGCAAPLATILWVVNSNDTNAECSALKGKRVAVVCRPSSPLLPAEGATAGGELAAAVGGLLKENVKKIDIVSQKEVDDWHDNNGTKSYQELGKALKVDYVVALDLEKFGVYQGPGLYQGRAHVGVTVFDIAKGDHKDLKAIESSYPPSHPVPTDVPERQFRANFIHVVAGQIARKFYAFDSRMLNDQYYHE